MDTLANPPKLGKPDLMTRAIGASDECVSLAPADSATALRATTVLVATVMAYQTIVLALLALRLFDLSGPYQLLAPAASLGIAFMLAQLDVSVFIQASYFATGLHALRRFGGLDFEDHSHEALLKSVMGFVARGTIALAFSGLTAIAVGLLIYASDIDHFLDAENQAANRPAIIAGEQRADAGIEKAAASEAAQQTQVEALAKELATDRSAEVNPLLADPQIAAAQSDVDRLAGELSSTQAAADTAANMAADEAGGVQSSSTTGVAGRGPKTIAAEAKAATAASRAKEVAGELAAARARLGALTAQFSGDLDTIRQRAKAQAQSVAASLDDATAKLASFHATHDGLVTNRAATIKADVESAEGYNPPQRGLLAEMTALRALAEKPEVLVVCLLVDGAALTLELAFVLSRALGGLTPTVYCAIWVRQTIVRVAQIAEDADFEMNLRRDPDDDDGSDPDITNSADHPGPSGPVPNGGWNLPSPSNGEPPKRGRGRPRKYPPAN